MFPLIPCLIIKLINIHKDIQKYYDEPRLWKQNYISEYQMLMGFFL